MQVPFSVFVQAVRSNEVLAVAIDDRYTLLHDHIRKNAGCVADCLLRPRPCVGSLTFLVTPDAPHADV